MKMLAVAEIETLPVADARAGAPEAWDTLFKRYQLPLYTFIYEWIHEESASLDIVQETFISAARNIDSLRDDEKFGSWLFGIAHQKCIQRWRRQHREADTLEAMADDLPESGEDPANWLIRQEQETEFMELVNQLSPPHRAAFLLYVVEDFPLEEIAAITKAPLGTVKSRLHYAKKTLRKLWEEKL